MYVTYIHTTKHLYTAYTYIWRIWRTNIAISNINCCDLLRIYCIIPHESSYINKCFGADFLSLEFLRVKSTNLFGIPQNLEHFIYSWFGTSNICTCSSTSSETAWTLPQQHVMESNIHIVTNQQRTLDPPPCQDWTVALHKAPHSLPANSATAETDNFSANKNVYKKIGFFKFIEPPFSSGFMLGFWDCNPKCFTACIQSQTKSGTTHCQGIVIVQKKTRNTGIWDTCTIYLPFGVWLALKTNWFLFNHRRTICYDSRHNLLHRSIPATTMDEGP